MRTPPIFIQKVDNLILSHIDNPELLALLRKNFKLSTSQIYRKIKQKTGASPARYIRNKRLEIAKDLILESDISLTEIGHLVGFQQLSYFSRCFSKYFGYAASSLRKDRKQVFSSRIKYGDLNCTLSANNRMISKNISA